MIQGRLLSREAVSGLWRINAAILFSLAILSGTLTKKYGLALTRWDGIEEGSKVFNPLRGMFSWRSVKSYPDSNVSMVNSSIMDSGKSNMPMREGQDSGILREDPGTGGFGMMKYYCPSSLCTNSASNGSFVMENMVSMRPNRGWSYTNGRLSQSTESGHNKGKASHEIRGIRSGAVKSIRKKKNPYIVAFNGRMVGNRDSEGVSSNVGNVATTSLHRCLSESDLEMLRISDGSECSVSDKLGKMVLKDTLILQDNTTGESSEFAETRCHEMLSRLHVSERAQK